MKLYYSPASPFASKVRATVIECGLQEQVSLVATNPHESQPDFVAINPFSKIPVLVLDDGAALFESYFICEYLDSIAGGGVVLPKQGQDRRAVLHKHMLGNGVMEAAVLRRVESLRGKDPDREKNIARQITIIGRGLDCIEAEADKLGQGPGLGNLCIAIALSYLDFRFGADQWRSGRQRLAKWHEQYAARPAIAETAPRAP
ncbi:MAG: glutathione S-transferase family protein [Burkholderiales bacterium]|nr:glutathione S-transferase family protein [Burkholderiales bacterium]